jgi:hypothetical protein
MNLSDLSVAKRRETVALALSFVLQDLKAPAPTTEVVERVAHRLETSETKLIARTITSWADRIPEAEVVGTFQKYGRTMRRFTWHPKGTNVRGATVAADPWTVDL